MIAGLESESLIVVSNRLPFCRHINEKGEVSWKKAAGGLITALEPILQENHGLWIGWDGYPSEDDGVDFEFFESADIALEQGRRSSSKGSYKILCIPLTQKDVEEYYDGFSNSTLWSLFHYFFEKSHIHDPFWETYLDVNRRFAETIAKVAKDDDVVWIQDYHLFMVPYLLRELRPNLKIHFFLHIPFPNIDIFSILPCDKLIVKSLLSCDSIGFQTPGNEKNFRDLIDVYCKDLGFGNKFPEIYSNPISIDFDLITETSQKPSVQKRRGEIRKISACDTFIVGVDRIDYSKGIKERLLALELLMQEHPEFLGKFYYYQLVVPSRESVVSYQILKKEVDEIVGRINGLYSTDEWTPIHYHYHTLDFDELVAYYSAADIALVTPLRDGMNLVSKEYVAAHSDKEGILVLSRFAGASRELKEALIVNPYNIDDIKSAIVEAVMMTQSEKKRRMTVLRDCVKGHDIHDWVSQCAKRFHPD